MLFLSLSLFSVRVYGVCLSVCLCDVLCSVVEGKLARAARQNEADGQAGAGWQRQTGSKEAVLRQNGRGALA